MHDVLLTTGEFVSGSIYDSLLRTIESGMLAIDESLLLKTALADAEIVMADNVSEYLEELGERKADFPVDLTEAVVVPPYPAMFFDYRVMQALYGHSPGRLGILLMTDDLKKAGYDAPPEYPKSEDARWRVTLMMFLQVDFGEGRRGVMVFDDSAVVAHVVYLIGEDGCRLRGREFVAGGITPYFAKSAEFRDAMVSVMGYEFNAIQFALSLLHCKNVELSQRLPQKTRTRSARRRRAKANVPDFRHSVIRIRVPGGRGYTSDIGYDPNRGGSGRALHLVAGQFRTYTKEGGGLFGKYYGTYWIPAHIRGNRSKGTVKSTIEFGNGH